MPKWHEEARSLKESGMTISQIVIAMEKQGTKVTHSRVSQVTSPNWERHRELASLKFKAMNDEIDQAKKEGRLPDVRGAIKQAAYGFYEKEREANMTDRRFEAVSAKDPTDVFHRARIRCAEKGCDQTLIFSSRKTIHPVVARKWFHDKGWEVGADPRGDFCPKHGHGSAKHKPVEVPIMVHTNINVPKEEPMKPDPSLLQSTSIPETALEKTPKAIMEKKTVPMDGPAVTDWPSRTEKRTIILKLEEVYVDEEVGYRKGWNDEKVAADLGVSRLWVAAIRDDTFGPEISTRAHELAALSKDVQELAASTMKSIEEITELVRNVNNRLNLLDTEKVALTAAIHAFEAKEKE